MTLAKRHSYSPGVLTESHAIILPPSARDAESIAAPLPGFRPVVKIAGVFAADHEAVREVVGKIVDEPARVSIELGGPIFLPYANPCGSTLFKEKGVGSLFIFASNDHGISWRFEPEAFGYDHYSICVTTVYLALHWIEDRLTPRRYLLLNKFSPVLRALHRPLSQKAVAFW